MLIISSKKDIWKNASYAKKDSFLDFDLDSELAMDDTVFAKITKKSFKRQVKGKRVLLLIHGYNPDFLDVLASYSTLNQNIGQNASKKSVYDEIIGYTWHLGNDDLKYPVAKELAVAASERLRTVLNKTLSGADSIDVMTHSLGSRVLLRALATGKKSNRPKIRNHFCMAAAVSNTCLNKGKRLRKATKQAKATWVFHSTNDASLQSTKLLAKSNTALGLTGPCGKVKKYPKNTAAVDCSEFVYSHGGYKRSQAFYSFLKCILSKEIAVGEKQFELEPSTTPHQI